MFPRGAKLCRGNMTDLSVDSLTAALGEIQRFAAERSIPIAIRPKQVWFFGRDFLMRRTREGQVFLGDIEGRALQFVDERDAFYPALPPA